MLQNAPHPAFRAQLANQRFPNPHAETSNNWQSVRASVRGQGADRSFVFASGMAALTTVTRLVHTGQRILTGDDIYGGTSRLLSRVLPKQGINVTNVDMTDLAVRMRSVTHALALVPVFCEDSAAGLREIRCRNRADRC